MRTFAISAALLVAAPAAAQIVEDPLAPAREGLLQCHAPDLARKTCMAIVAYQITGDRIVAPAEMLVSYDGPIIMSQRTIVYVKGSAVCGVVTPSDYTTARYTIGGRAMPAQQAQQLAAQIVNGNPLLNTELCTSYRRSGSMLRAESTAGGRRIPEVDMDVIWVRRSEGFRLGG